MSAMFACKHSSARCLAAVGRAGDATAHVFLVGTSSVREENELCVLEYVEEEEVFTQVAAFAHAGEVWTIAPCPSDPGLVITGAQSVVDGKIERRTTLWRMPGIADVAGGGGGDGSASMPVGAAPEVSAHARGELRELVVFPAVSLERRLIRVLWDPHGRPGAAVENLLTVDDQNVRLWTLGGAALQATGSMSVSESGRTAAAAWDPHHEKEVALAVGHDIATWDIRSMRCTHVIKDAHGGTVRDVHYNPNKPWYVLSAGADCLVKFWDLRKLEAPLRVLKGHTHWVTSAQYNPFHDQLVMSGSSDSGVVLWRVSSISSAPLLALGEEATTVKDCSDALVTAYNTHDDAVCAVAWSAKDAWLATSLSVTGHVIAHTVGNAEKYNILL